MPACACTTIESPQATSSEAALVGEKGVKIIPFLILAAVYAEVSSDGAQKVSVLCVDLGTNVKRL
jgi:hypothetical protein